MVVEGTAAAGSSEGRILRVSRKPEEVVVEEVERGVGMPGRGEIDPGRLGQAAHLQPGFLEQVEIHLGPAQAALAGRVDGMGHGPQQQVGDEIGQAARLVFVEAALGDPGSAQADAGRVARVLVAIVRLRRTWTCWSG